MRRLALLLALVACTDPIGPEDPRHEELCTIYVGVGERAEITRWMIEHCESVSVIVVKFGGSTERFEVRPLELDTTTLGPFGA